ncbi:serine O-acetyltransferase [Phormidium sp. CLA17]|uniref:serine O-acetyltransferase n=1 Tax=Leptolyngbya sp. Cla-17 TaxID=2803751 RepID=UPI0014925238|nr:serine O-acetyltransferase [Leptolyngbya sp. Cla-17]MBM0740658.1 serine O-acetyltransferase [Leptolyngbya sp. Cla-17]
MLSILLADFRIIFDRDPAARNWLEVLFCYPGLQALLLHRFAHWLYRIGLPFVPRLISHWARFFTGIEIHPGAQIGQGVFIDHGMGVVIGETAIIGNYALIYQGVTLGGTGKECGKRHPTLGENVVVGAGAKVLGNLLIGNNVRIGAGSVVLRDVPSDCTVVGVPGRIVYRSGERVEPLEHGLLPDSEARVIRALVDRIENLEQQVQRLQPVPLKVMEPAIAVSASSNGSVSNGKSAVPDTWTPSTAANCRIRDRVIEEFLDGSGI